MRMLLVLGFVFVFCGAAQVLAAEVSSLRGASASEPLLNPPIESACDSSAPPSLNAIDCHESASRILAMTALDESSSSLRAVRSTAWQSTCQTRPRPVIASDAQHRVAINSATEGDALRASEESTGGLPHFAAVGGSFAMTDKGATTPTAFNDEPDSNIAAEFIISYKAHSNNESSAEKFNIATPTKKTNAHFASAPICEFDIEDSTLEIEESPPKQIRAFIKKALYKNQDLLKDCLFSKVGIFVDDHTTSINHAAKSQTSIALKPTRIRAVLGQNSLKIYQLRSEHE